MSNKKILELLKSPIVSIALVVAFVIVGFWLRTYKIDNPIADWHSWRQADTASVSRNFIKDGFNPLFPQYDALNPLNETGEPNPNRYFFAEFPLYNILTYYAYSNFGVNEVYARLISIIFATATIPLLYFLVRHYSGNRVALVASLLFAVLPYNVYYGRVTMPDPMYIFFSIATLLLVTHWLKSNNFILSLFAGLSFALACLEKPYALVLLLPIGYLILRRWKFKSFTNWKLYFFLCLGLIPFLLWRYHINQHPEGMFGTTWLYNQGNIRFTGAYFRWLVYERMNKLIFATGGFVLFWIGLIRNSTSKEGYFYALWLTAILLFFVVIAKGNVTHDYYQLPIVPIGCIFMALGVEHLITSGNSLIRRGISISTAIVLVLLLMAFGWYEVRGYYNINHPEIVEAGKFVDKVLPKDALVIAPYDNDSAFLYQTNRHGFTYGGDKIAKYRSEGAEYLISTNFDDHTNAWMKACKVMQKTESYVLVDLRECTLDINGQPAM